MPAVASVTVTYSDPARFTDAEDRSTQAEDVVSALARELETVGNRVVAPGTDLRIRILDIDRAGSPRLNLPNEIRVMNGRADFPCVELAYSLAAGDRTIRSARERVCDLNYLRRADLRYMSNDPLAYEKRMLSTWMRSRFGSRTD